MEYRRFGDTYVVRLDIGDEICESVIRLAEEEHIALAEVSGLGAVDEILFGLYDNRAQKYITNPFAGPYEITSLVGTITTKEGKPYLHAHMSAGDIRGNVVGGHLNSATISVTGELIVRVIPGAVERKFNPDIGINLLSFD